VLVAAAPSTPQVLKRLKRDLCLPRGNESWDFGDWDKAVSAGGRSYPLFVRSGRLCLDADKYDLRVGTPVRIWTRYEAANQFWS
jgi:hypothetical protein